MRGFAKQSVAGSLKAIGRGGVLIALITTAHADYYQPTLVSAAYGNGSFQLTVQGETNVPYIVESSTNLQSWSGCVTNAEASATRSIVIDAPDTSRFYRAVVARPLFAEALMAKGAISLSGGIFDSFDSMDPQYSLAGQYDPTRRREATVETSSTNVG